MTSIEEFESVTRDRTALKTSAPYTANLRRRSLMAGYASEQERLLAGLLHRRFGLVAMIYAGGSAALSLMVLRFGMAAPIGAWLFMLFGTLSVNLVLWARALPATIEDDRRAHVALIKWRDDHTAAMAVTSLAWGAAAFLLLPALPVGVLLPTIALLCLVVVAGSLASAAHIPCAIASTVPPIALICTAFLSYGKDNPHLFALSGLGIGFLTLIATFMLNYFLKDTCLNRVHQS